MTTKSASYLGVFRFVVDFEEHGLTSDRAGEAVALARGAFA